MTCIKRQCIEEDMGPRVWTRCSEDLKKKKKSIEITVQLRHRYDDALRCL